MGPYEEGKKEQEFYIVGITIPPMKVNRLSVWAITTTSRIMCCVHLKVNHFGQLLGFKIARGISLKFCTSQKNDAPTTQNLFSRTTCTDGPTFLGWNQSCSLLIPTPGLERFLILRAGRVKWWKTSWRRKFRGGTKHFQTVWGPGTSFREPMGSIGNVPVGPEGKTTGNLQNFPTRGHKMLQDF